MEIIKQSHEIIGFVPTDPIGNMQRIELVGRCCYQSYDKQTDSSYLSFTMKMIENKHLAMVEHSNMVIKINIGSNDHYLSEVESIINSKFIFHKVEFGYNGCTVYFGGNYRAWIELIQYEGTPFDLFNAIREYVFEIGGFTAIEVTDQKEIPNELKRITVFFRTNRAVTHELVRHRPPSYGQLSQRYVRYNDIQFIRPVGTEDDAIFKMVFVKSCLDAQQNYLALLSSGYKPQQARNVLTNAVATDIFVTADIPEWMHIFKLRCAKSADPQMQDVMIPVEQKFIELGWV